MTSITEAAQEITTINATLVKIQGLIESEQTKADNLCLEIASLQTEIEDQASDMALDEATDTKAIKALDVKRQALAVKKNDVDRAALAVKGLTAKLEKATQQRAGEFSKYDEMIEAVVLVEAEKLGREYLATAGTLFDLFFKISALDSIQRRTMSDRGQKDPLMCQSLARWTKDADMKIPSFDLKGLAEHTDPANILTKCQEFFHPFVKPERLAPYVQDAKAQLGIVDFRRGTVRKVVPVQEINVVPDSMADEVDQLDGLGLAPQVPAQTEEDSLGSPEKHWANEGPQIIGSTFMRNHAIEKARRSAGLD